jgi:methyl-accepting chemotaxis protein
MENPARGLIVKLSAAAAVLLLATAAVLAVAGYLGPVKDPVPGLFAIVAAAFVSGFAIFLANISYARARAELKRAVQAAQQLSQGVPAPNTCAGELNEALEDIARYLSDRAELATRIADGDLLAVEIPGHESDILGRALEQLADRMRETAEIQEGRDRMHDSLRKLLNDVSGVSSGDLTVYAEAGPDVTGAVGDAFNSMTRSLCSLIRQVKAVTCEIGSSAASITETTEQLARGSVIQASQITRTSGAVSGIARKTCEIADSARSSANVASDSLLLARSGLEAASNNLGAMNCVRNQVQETSKRVKRLGERAQEIGQIVGHIEDLSDQTGLLALNASLSCPDGANQGFETVVREIERLAERSTRLARQVSDLALTINVETRDVVSAIDETIHEVVVGSALADKAARTLEQIESTSARLAESLATISESAQVLSDSSDEVSNTMLSIAEVTELVQGGSTRAAESMRSLLNLAAELRVSVDPFKLPPETNERPTFSDTARFLN